MAKSASLKCVKCGKSVRAPGAEFEGEAGKLAMCKACVKAIFPEAKNLPVIMDGEANLFYVDKPGNRMTIFFSYGEVPYSSCTEVSLEEEEEFGCGIYLY